MIFGNNFLAAVGASIASVVLILIATRVLFGRHPRRAMALTRSWLRLPIHRVASLIIALSLGSALCFAKIADNVTTPERATEIATIGNLALDSPIASCAGDPGSFTDASQQAYDRFREYANGLRAKLNDRDPPNISQPLGATPDLPDVDTMIGRLAKKLETDSGNVDGWRMLGWSYLHTGKYSEAVAAYTTALALDPKNSDTVKALEEAQESAKGRASDKAMGVDGETAAKLPSIAASDAADANSRAR